MRSVGLVAVYQFGRELLTTVYTVLFFGFLLAHAAIWVYSLILFANEGFRLECKDLKEHYFFVKAYALVVAVMLVVAVVVIIILALPVIILTIKAFKR